MSHLSQIKRIVFAILATLGALNAPSVLASATYAFDCSKTDCSNSNTSAWGNTRALTAVESVSGQTISVTATAVANTNGTDPTNNGASQKIETAYLGAYGTVGSSSGSYGLGVTNRDGLSSGADLDASEGVTPEHAIDNNQRYDMVLLTFSSAVTLSQIKLGYANTDSDISILAYGGSSTTAPLSGLTYAQLVTNGWVAIGSYADVGTSTAASVNAGNFSSTTWLVGAYNPLTGDKSCASCDVGNDYIKLLSFSIKDQSTPTTQVPEPGSLALAGLALAGVVVSRRNKK
jgi:hypothetical protein